MIINFPRNKQIVTYILSALLLALFPARLCASALTLAWNPNTESDLAGYRVYYGTASGVYIDSVDVGNTTTYRLDGLLDGVTYYIAVTAYDTSGNESDFSKEVSGIGTSPSCCAKPTVQAPSGDQPTYGWDGGGGQWEWFWVYVQNLSTGVLYGSGWVNASTNTWTQPSPLPWGNYRVWVRVYHSQCGYSEWSDPVDFTVGNCTGKPTVQTPSGDQPTYQWDGAGGQWTWYWVYVQNLSTGAYYGTGTANNGWVNSPDDSWASPHTLPWGNYRAWVRVYHENCGLSEWSDPVDFTVGNCTGKPTVQTPSGDQPTYQWDGAGGQWTWYWVYVQNLSTGAYYGTGTANNGWVNSPGNFWDSTYALPVGNYRAWIQVYHESCGFSEWSDPVDWTVF